MLTSGCAVNESTDYTHQSFVWFSNDGGHWTEKSPIGPRDHWLWRPAWVGSRALCLGYRTNSPEERYVSLYESTDGQNFDLLVDRVYSAGYPNESSFIFVPNQTAFCLLRRDPHAGDSGTARLGRAEPPYQHWSWSDLGVRIGGPDIILLDDGRVIAAVRLYDGHTRTSLCWLDMEQGRLTEFLRLPSGGDTSYPGLVWHEDQLWLSYYSSHEAKGNSFSSAIYVARVEVP
jgi:hypothetical protein